MVSKSKAQENGSDRLSLKYVVRIDSFGRVIALLCVALVLGGCTVVGSYHPLFSSEDSSADLPLEGVWEFEKPDPDFDLKNLTVLPVSQGHYTLSYTVNKQNSPQVYQFRVTLGKLGDHVFYDATFDQVTWKGLTIKDEELACPSIHFLGMVTVEGDNAELMPLDGDWLDKALQDGKVQIPHENEKGVLLLTVKPHDLKKFLLAYSRNPEAFPTMKFHRRKLNAQQE
jgi:hypothetical protein